MAYTQENWQLITKIQFEFEYRKGASLLGEKQVRLDLTSMNLFAAKDKLALGNRSEGNERQDVIGQSRQNWQDQGYRNQSGEGFLG